jgi:hypothetical protein
VVSSSRLVSEIFSVASSVIDHLFGLGISRLGNS